MMEAGGAMHRTIRILDLEQSVREVLEEVKKEHVPYILTEGSRPEAVIVPYDEFLKLQKFRELDVLSRFDEVWARMGTYNARVSEDEIEEDVAAARRDLSQR
jgi:prevent-host-death family protein